MCPRSHSWLRALVWDSGQSYPSPAFLRALGRSLVLLHQSLWVQPRSSIWQVSLGLAAQECEGCGLVDSSGEDPPRLCPGPQGRRGRAQTGPRASCLPRARRSCPHPGAACWPPTALQEASGTPPAACGGGRRGHTDSHRSQAPARTVSAQKRAGSPFT